MAHVISDLSKYIILIFMIIYTLLCFISLFYKQKNKDEHENWIYTIQIICMFLVHFIGFSAICLETGDVSYIIFYGFQQIMLFATIALFYVIYPKVNRLLINNMCLLLAVGFVILTRISYKKCVRQVEIVAVSLIVGLLIPLFIKKIALLKKLTWLYMFVGIVSLAVVYILGATTHGSKISYTVAGFTFQPSEFIKIVFVFCMAGLLTKAQTFSQILLSACIAAVHVIILVISKDLGSALIFFAAYIFMVFVATKNYFYLLSGLLAGSAGAYLGYKLFPHVQKRIIAWKNPWDDINNTGFQITQSLFAIGTGSWYGMGIYQGDPTSIPYVEQDFVFSAVAEEFGVLFAISVILVCLSCFLAFMQIAATVKDIYYRNVAVGISVLYIFQVFLTIGGGTRFIPLTGVTLPLVSYGGSSVLTTIIMFSIMQGISLLRVEHSTLSARS